MSRKIAVIGAGADAVATVAQLIARRDNSDSIFQDDEITWIRDCSHKIDNFGVQVNTLWLTVIATNTTIVHSTFIKDLMQLKNLG
jgi:hypothetical protein